VQKQILLANGISGTTKAISGCKPFIKWCETGKNGATCLSSARNTIRQQDQNMTGTLPLSDGGREAFSMVSCK
jgi:hypothetical protein